ncbi:hypothetical protein HERIO_444 [Hepatospora eriocheir]|uniref:Uncharacterized protein n=1 Tax=Hepatospora eriocheir TaxID=1081669 RepID=A0A1X0QD34_9MICR|nr:hypothetical protein HERIO_444 [Hepatospora eriocheir]
MSVYYRFKFRSIFSLFLLGLICDVSYFSYYFNKYPMINLLFSKRKRLIFNVRFLLKLILILLNNCCKLVLKYQ